MIKVCLNIIGARCNYNQFKAQAKWLVKKRGLQQASIKELRWGISIRSNIVDSAFCLLALQLKNEITKGVTRVMALYRGAHTQTELIVGLSRATENQSEKAALWRSEACVVCVVHYAPASRRKLANQIFRARKVLCFCVPEVMNGLLHISSFNMCTLISTQVNIFPKQVARPSNLVPLFLLSKSFSSVL